MELNPVHVINMVKVSSTLAFLGVLALQDLREREMSANLVYAYVAISAAVFAASLYFGDMPPLVMLIYALFSLVATAGLFTSLFKLGLVGDGDVFVSLAIGLALFNPSTYDFTLTKVGILPPSIVVVFYAALTSVVLMVLNSVVVLTRYRCLLKHLSLRQRLLLPFVGKPVRLREYLEGKLKHHYLVQEFTYSSRGVVTRYKTLIRVERNELSRLRELVDKGLLSPDTYVWVSPGIPFVFHLFLGVMLLIVLGDRPLALLFLWQLSAH